MAAVGEDSEAALAGIGLLKHHLHAHAAHHVLAALDGEGDLHVLLVGLDARLKDAAEGRNVSFRSPWKQFHWLRLKNKTEILEKSCACFCNRSSAQTWKSA